MGDQSPRAPARGKATEAKAKEEAGQAQGEAEEPGEALAPRTYSNPAGELRRGSLTVVGTGIQFAAHMTAEARAHIEQADKVLFVVSEPATTAWIRERSPSAESLSRFYKVGKPRMETYEQMVEEILLWVRKGLDVCAVFYGHPGVFTYPSHTSIRRAREEGFPARMLPGVSAEDCLFADLGVDPGNQGCQSFEASYFLLRKKAPDTGVPLLLWQLGVVGRVDYQTTYVPAALKDLVAMLRKSYGGEQRCVLYEAAVLPTFEPQIIRTTINGLLRAEIPPMATLYIPAKGWDLED